MSIRKTITSPSLKLEFYLIVRLEKKNGTYVARFGPAASYNAPSYEAEAGVSGMALSRIFTEPYLESVALTGHLATSPRPNARVIRLARKQMSPSPLGTRHRSGSYGSGLFQELISLTDRLFCLGDRNMRLQRVDLCRA